MLSGLPRADSRLLPAKKKRRYTEAQMARAVSRTIIHRMPHDMHLNKIHASQDYLEASQHARGHVMRSAALRCG
jgi:hypothetical protein